MFGQGHGQHESRRRGKKAREGESPPFFLPPSLALGTKGKRSVLEGGEHTTIQRIYKETKVDQGATSELPEKKENAL